MTRSLYKRNKKLENASVSRKNMSKSQRRLNHQKKITKQLATKNKIRLEQQRRDHEFIDILKTDFHEVYLKVVGIFKKKYPNLQRIKGLSKKEKEIAKKFQEYDKTAIKPIQKKC